MDKTTIIAEIGENFIGDMKIAKKLIVDAAAAGADYVKFQSYQPQTFRPDDPEYDWFKKVSLSDNDHKELMKVAAKEGIQFMSAPFDLDRAKLLCEDLGCKDIKIASGMMMNFDLLDYINDHAETVFLSTGMATVDEIKQAFSRLNKVARVYILHCVTQYPCEDVNANLLAIKSLQTSFPENEIGYSDHTLGTEAAVMAVALGATVIEKHFTFDKNAKEGTDHVLSVEPEELKEMVAQIRRAELMLGSAEKNPTESEKGITDFVRNRFVNS